MMIGKEEIIRTLDALANWQGSLSLTDKERVAIVTAMEAVKRQDKDVVPTEFHEKCMSKQLRRVAELEKQLNKLDRPHGEWEFVQRGKFVDMVCPFCKDVCVDGIAYNYSIDEVKETIESDTFSIHGKQDFPNFCPNCGADMRDKKDDLAEIIEAVQSIKEGESE